jgi:protein ImuB
MVRLAIPVTEPLRPSQASLEGREQETEEEELAALTDRLAARFGTERVLGFQAAHTHHPDRAARTVPLASVEEGGSPFSSAANDDAAGEPPIRPVFLFEPPLPIETLAEVPDGPPLRFRWRRVLHEVARAEGPERIAPEWWRGEDGLTRDYYRVEDAAGRRFWVFREGLYGHEATTPRWFLHGLFA